MRIFSLHLPSEHGPRRALIALVAIQLLVWIGASAIIPLLPTYLSAHGASPATVGVVMGAYFAASVLTQYPLGRQSDRIGPRAIIVVGLAVFALGALGFAFFAGAASSIAFRSLQGIGAGAVTVASTSTVALSFAPSERGSGFALLYGSQMLGLAIGPLFGGLLGSSSMRLLFIVSAVLALVAIAPARSAMPTRVVPRANSRSPRHRLRASPALIGTTFVFVAIGLLTGMYEACWSLLLHTRHATSIEIGLSWTLYCLPFALFSGTSGRLADRMDRRILVVVGVGTSATFAVIYPLLHSVVLLVCLGCLEAVGAVLVTPAALSILTERTPEATQGAAQGAIGSARTAATALGAAGCGLLFGIAHPAPFDAVAATMALCAGATMWSWRRLPGRVGRTAARGDGSPRTTFINGASAHDGG